MELNNIISHTPKTITSLRFNVPLYQRLFEWSTPQLRGLLSDLASHIVKTHNKPYYIGMITANQNKVIDLIDGQQRFISIMLLGIVLREYDPEWNSFVTSERLSFSARPNDKAYLNSLIYREEVKDIEVNPYMQKGLRVIKDFLDNDLSEYEISKIEFAHKVYEQITFFVSFLPNNYRNNPKKLNQYFEAMNSSGRSLEQHEKLKVDLLTRISDRHDKAVLNSIWNISADITKPVFFSRDEEMPLNIVDNCIVDLVNNKTSLKEFSEKKSSDDDAINLLSVEQIAPSSAPPAQKIRNQQSSSIINFEELLLLALDVTLDQQKAYDKSKLEERFRSLPSERIKDFYHNLIICRLILDRFVIRIYKDGQYNQYELTLSEEGLHSNIIKQNKQYQAMLYAAGNPEVHHLWLTPFIKWIIKHVKEFGSAPTPEQLYSRLRKIDDSIPSHRLSDVEILRYGQSTSIYLFQRLDYILWKKVVIDKDDSINTRYKELIERFIPGTNRSIEHLHPQNEEHNEKWPEVFEDVIDPLNTFGNLALISADFNSRQSNDNENLKLARIKEHIDSRRIQSLKLLLMYEVAIENGGHWTVDLAVNHGCKMMGLLKESYNKGF